ncbi:MAG: class I SAM-dependent methyltransferase, partial [Chlamydiia bacterium]|nr:class I SAM-dependent methyltransferase [Chlamydiia bacterium]
STLLMGSSKTALDTGAEIAGRQGLTCTLKKGSFSQIQGQYDTIILSHKLFTLDIDPLEVIAKLQGHLKEGGHLVLIESSQDLENRKMLRLRDALVKKGHAVQAPCVWKGPCPALEGKFPCYAQREMEKPYLLKELQRKLDINLGSLKMSYLIIKRLGDVWPQLPQGQEFYRVVSPRFETEEGSVVYLCGTPGKRKLFSRLAEVPQSAKAFNYLRRGDLITVEGAAGKNALQLLEDSEVKVASACGKPLPEVR